MEARIRKILNNGGDISQKFWSPRKLLVLQELFRVHRKKNFHVSDFIYPTLYPKSTRSQNWEGFRVLKCLSELKRYGVTMHTVAINPLLFDYFNNLTPEVFEDIGAQWQPKNSGLVLPFSQFWKLINQPWLHTIDEEGEGMFIDEYVHKPDTSLALVCPGFLTLDLSINRKKLGTEIDTYLKSFKKGLLRVSRPSFSFFSLNSLVKEYINGLSQIQGKEIVLRLREGDHAEQTMHIDSLLFYLKHKYPDKYTYWKEEGYILRIVEQMLVLEKGGFIEMMEYERELEDLHSVVKDTKTARRYFGFDQVDIRVDVRLSLIQKKQKQETKVDTITHIRLVTTKGSMFSVQLNTGLVHVRYSKARKSGSLIYQLASVGYADHKDYASAYEHFTQDARCRLFSETHTQFQPIMELRDDGYIYPAKGVHFELKEPENESSH